MSGVKNLVAADNKGQVPITNEMLKEEAMESQTSTEETSEKAK
jgi:hypothetical protein